MSTNASSSVLLSTLLELENRVWKALMDGDPVADDALLDEEFIGVYATGFATKQGHVAQLRSGPVLTAFSLAEPRVLEVGEGAALLLYRAEFTRAAHSSNVRTEVMYVSSLWRHRLGKWRNVFSQDTRAA